MRYEDAINDFNEVIRLDSKDAFAYHNRAFSYRALGNHKKAAADRAKAAKLRKQQK